MRVAGRAACIEVYAARLPAFLTTQISATPSMTRRDRLARYAGLSAALALRSDHQLARRVDDAEQLASGIGGSTLTFSLNGHPVFAKRVRLTDLELNPAHRMSTANLFGLPTYYQRNVGSAGFGAWRELAANVMTTGWVLAQQLESFPLMYHWRVLEGPSSPGAAPRPVEWTDVERMTRYWGDADAMRARLVALAEAKFSLMIGKFRTHEMQTRSVLYDASKIAEQKITALQEIFPDDSSKVSVQPSISNSADAPVTM